MRREINIWDKLLYALSVGILLSGLRALFGVHTPKPLSLGLIGISLIVLYTLYIKRREGEHYETRINTKHVCLGVILILVDLLYSIYANSPLGPFDYTMIASGLFIIFLNLGLYRILKLDSKAVDFATYFLFITLLLYSVPIGIAFLSGTSEFFLIEYVAMASITISTFFLNFIKPAAYIGGNIHFEYFSVGIGTPCSGVDSMTIFLAAAIAYFVAVKEQNLKKIFIYSVMGIIAMFLLNIVRIMIIVLVGYHYGGETMLLFHDNMGWIMFALSMTVFWLLVVHDYKPTQDTPP